MANILLVCKMFVQVCSLKYTTTGPHHRKGRISVGFILFLVLEKLQFSVNYRFAVICLCYLVINQNKCVCRDSAAVLGESWKQHRNGGVCGFRHRGGLCDFLSLV